MPDTETVPPLTAKKKNSCQIFVNLAGVLVYLGNRIVIFNCLIQVVSKGLSPDSLLLLIHERVEDRP